MGGELSTVQCVDRILPRAAATAGGVRIFLTEVLVRIPPGQVTPPAIDVVHHQIGYNRRRQRQQRRG